MVPSVRRAAKVSLRRCTDTMVQLSCPWRWNGLHQIELKKDHPQPLQQKHRWRHRGRMGNHRQSGSCGTIPRWSVPGRSTPPRNLRLRSKTDRAAGANLTYWREMEAKRTQCRRDSSRSFICPIDRPTKILTRPLSALADPTRQLSRSVRTSKRPRPPGELPSTENVVS